MKELTIKHINNILLAIDMGVLCNKIDKEFSMQIKEAINQITIIEAQNV